MQGGFGICCKVKSETDEVFACKITKTADAVVDEAAIHSGLSHDNVVKFIHHDIVDDNTVMSKLTFLLSQSNIDIYPLKYLTN